MKHGVVLLLALLAAAPVAAQECPAVKEGPQPLEAVRYLADDALEGRLSGTAGERCAGEYVAAEFQRIGLEPAGEHGSWFQEVPLASVVNPHAPAGTGRNVIALLPGTDPALAREPVIIGAHLDHLGYGPFGSLAPDDRAIHNGADDNASGVSALIRAAELLAARPAARPVIFIAFTGEEFGLLGSAHFASQPTVPIASARAMLNMDMVGRLAQGGMIVSGTATAAEWERLLGAANTDGITMAFQGDGYGPSDHTSFYSKDIPVLHFFTNTHADYHRPSDDWQKIDVAGVDRVAGLVARVASAVAGRPAALALQRGAGTPPQAGGGGGYGAWLGTVPDFTPVEYGVKLGGVSGGSPAEKAGLTAGDIIIRLNDDDIKDLYAMTDFLRAHKPGDAVRVTFLRDGREMSVGAVLGSRSR